MRLLQVEADAIMFDAFHDVAELAKAGSRNAQEVMESWAAGEWFTGRDEVPESIKMVVFKVAGETNTDDLSPAPDAWSRPDIPLHALAMFKMARDGIEPDEAGTTGPLNKLRRSRAKASQRLSALVGSSSGSRYQFGPLVLARTRRE